MSEYSQYGNVKPVEPLGFPQEPQVDIQFVWNDQTTGVFCEDIRSFWDDPEDFVDLGGHTVILPYCRVLVKGEEHLKEILKKIDKKRRRQGTSLRTFPALWAKIKEAASEDNSFF